MRGINPGLDTSFQFMTPERRKLLRRVFVTVGLLAVSAAFVGIRALRDPKPGSLAHDLRAGWAARNVQDPDRRLHVYLSERYGPMTEATNRERVFVDFFDPERIRTLQFLVKNAPENRRQESIEAMARWVADYRASLTPEERASLSARFQGPEGQARLGKATAQYNAQDVRYRGSTAPVISELLRTLNQLEPSR